MYGQTNNTQRAGTENLAAHRLAGNEAIHLYVFTCGVFMSWRSAELLHDARPLHFKETTFGSRNLIFSLLQKPCFCSSARKARRFQRQGQSSIPKAHTHTLIKRKAWMHCNKCICQKNKCKTLPDCHNGRLIQRELGTLQDWRTSPFGSPRHP